MRNPRRSPGRGAEAEAVLDGLVFATQSDQPRDLRVGIGGVEGHRGVTMEWEEGPLGVDVPRALGTSQAASVISAEKRPDEILARCRTSSSGVNVPPPVTTTFIPILRRWGSLEGEGAPG